MQVTPQQLIAEQVQPDTFLAGFDLRLCHTFHPLGFPVRLETNSREVIEAAKEGWSEFTQAFDGPPLRLCLGVIDSGQPVLTLKSVFSAREHLATLFADPANFVVCDFRENFSFGWVTRGLAMDHSLLRYRFLLPTAHMMAEQKALAPVHAALVAKDGAGVMLCGDSMAGKSTLAFACARAGWSYVTDDGTFLVRGEADRYAIGDFSNVRLREDAVRFFPELGNRMAVVRPNGKVALEIPTRELPIRTLPGHSVDHVVYLDRCESAGATLLPHSRELAIEDWKQHVPFGTAAVRNAQMECHRRLLSAGMWSMRYAHLDDAIARLERLVATGC
jgi:hypothetical protein